MYVCENPEINVPVIGDYFCYFITSIVARHTIGKYFAVSLTFGIVKLAVV